MREAIAMHMYLALLAACATAAFSAPLDDYVYTPDPEYKWEYVSNITGEGFTAHTLNLTSQRWGHAPFQFIERGYQVWSHFLTIGTTFTSLVFVQNHVLFVHGNYGVKWKRKSER